MRQVIVIVAYSSPVHPYGATFLSITGYQPVIADWLSPLLSD